MAENVIKIGGRLHSSAQGNVLAGANEIYDDEKQKKQSVINAEVDEALANLQEALDGIHIPTTVDELSDATDYAKKTDLQSAISDMEGQIPQKVSDLTNDSEFQTSSQVDAKVQELQGDSDKTIEDLEDDVEENKINSVGVVVNNGDGNPSASASFANNRLELTLNNFKGEKGDALTWNDLTEEQKASLKGPQGDSVLVGQGDLPLAHVLGNDNTKAMSQKGVKDALNEYSAVQKTTDLTAYPQYNCTPGESTWIFDNEYQKHIVVPVPDGSKSVIINIASGKPFALFYLLASYNTAPTSGATPDCCEESVTRHRLEPGQNPEVLLPANCKYIAFSVGASGTNPNLLPEDIYFNVATSKMLKEGHDAEISVNISDYPKRKCTTGGSSWVYANESQEHIVVPVPDGAKSIVINASATNALFYLLKSYTEPASGDTPDCCEVTVTRYEVSQAQSPCEIPLPATCKYVAFSVSTSGSVVRLPLNIVFRVPANHATVNNSTAITEINEQLYIKSLKEAVINSDAPISSYINNNGNWASESDSNASNAIECIKGDKFIIVANNNNYATYAWLSALDRAVGAAAFVAGESKIHVVAAGTTTSVLTAPAGTKYLYFSLRENGTERTPLHVYKLKEKTVKEKVNENEEDLSKIFISPSEYEQRPYATGASAWAFANQYQKHIVVPVPQGSKSVVIKVDDVSTLFYLLKSYVQPNPRVTAPDCCEGSVVRHEVTADMSPYEITLPATCKYIAFSVATSGISIDRLPENVYFIKDEKPLVPYNLYDLDGLDAAFAACRKQSRDFLVKDSYYSYLRILQMTDIHNDVTRLMNAVKIANYMEALFLGTGDYQYLFFTDDSNELLGEFPHANDAMYCLGNHDTAHLTAADGSHQAYEKFIAPFAEQYGYEVEADKTYFYRDFSTYKIRIIAINQYEPYPEKTTTGDECMSQAQITWLLNCLLPYDAVNNPNGLKDDYSVIIAMHRPEVAHDFSMGTNKFQDCTPSDWFADFRYGTPIYDIIDAFNLKSSLTRTYTNTSIPTTSIMERSFDVDVDFSVNEGRNVEFVGFFCGHTHKDAIYQIPDRASKMWMLDAPATCAQYDDSRSVTNFNTVSDLPRQSGTKVENALNYYVIDTDLKMIRIVRIGSQVPYTLDKRRDYMAISYAQEQD